MASRYVKPKRNFISILTLLSMVGPIIGVAVLVTVIAVMSGFSHNIKDRILNMQSHFTLHGLFKNFDDPEADIKRLNEIPGLRSSAIIEGAVLLQTSRDVSPQLLMGIMPEYEKSVTDLYKNIIEGRYNLKDNEVLVGSVMAVQHNISVGSKIVLHSLDALKENIDFSGGEVKMVKDPSFELPKELTVAGIFTLGMEKYNSGIIFTNLDTADDILGKEWGTATAIKVKTPDAFDLKDYEAQIQDVIPYASVMNWQESNRYLFSALKSEKNMMFFLLFFIVLIAAFGIGGTLLTFAIQKNREIGVMKALGATPWQIMRIFLILGFIVGFISTTLGTLLGVTIVHYRDNVADFLSWIKGDEIFPSNIYQLTKIPGQIIPSDLITIFAGSILLCVLAALLPALFTAYSNPAKALKSEELL